MQKLQVVLMLFAMVNFISGCAVTLPTTAYTPQNYIKISGRANMGVFTYQPLILGKVKKANQMQNTAAGQIYMSMSIAEFVKRGTALELEKSGLILNDSSPITIQGDIIEFMADDLGYSVDLRYSIRYKIINKQDSSVLFDKTFVTPEKKIGKFGDTASYVSVASEMVLAGYELFARDPKVIEIFANFIDTEK